jgi:hypothetical protein
MKFTFIRVIVTFVLVCNIGGLVSQFAHAEDSQKVFFHVRHVEETALYIDIGRNFGLQEGMTLPLFRVDPSASSRGNAPSTTLKPIASLKVMIVADSSAVCEILNTSAEVRIGDVGFVAATGKPQPSQSDGATAGENIPISRGILASDPQQEQAEPASFTLPTSLPQRNTAVRVGFDYDQTQVNGGFRAREFGFQVQSDMTHIANTNWNFTGYWRSRFRETYSGLNGAQLESLSDRVDRTYHIGLYYENPNSPFIAGFGRLSVPGAPSLPTIDGGYLGRKINHHVTVGAFGGSTPDPTAWDYNPNQRIAGFFTNIETGNFDRLHFSGSQGMAMTAIGWRAARQFAFFENTISWKGFLWFYNSTQVDAARKSPLNGDKNNTGISFTSSSIRVQPVARFSFGLNHSYLNSLPSFDPNLLGTSLLDKYIFQGFSVDARYELAPRISLFTQVGRAKSIADKKNMWNSLYGVSLGDVLNSGFRADLRYAKFASTFGQGNYEAISLTRTLLGNLQVEFLAGIQSLASNATTNTSSRFVSTSFMRNLGPRLFIETGYTLSRGTTMNYVQWNTTLGYRFGSMRPQ